MSVPAGIDADRGPPMAVPLAHFLVGFASLLAGAALGVLGVAGFAPGLSEAAHVHLLLVGWVCLTILGAMTQFVPVWSGVELHSRRLALAQLALVAGGVAGFAGLLLAGRLDLLLVAGAAMLAGFWLFVYNVRRTLSGTSELDATERHFALALGHVLLVTTLGFALALDFVRPTLAPAGFARSQVVAAHATLAVFGIVLTTVVGALYQLATMFTQTELHGVDTTLQRVEEWAYTPGVLALAAGRLVGAEWVTRVGGVLALAGLLAFAAVLARKLRETRVERTPMLSRYVVVAAAVPAWALAALPSWLARPADPATTFGHPVAGHLLVAGAVGFVLLGTLYHVVPFVVWVRRYSDRVGLEPVPTIGDLYDARLAVADFWLALSGVGLVVLGEVGGVETALLAGGTLATLGFAVFAANLTGVVVRHGPESLRVGALGGATEKSTDDADEQSP
jgi:cbb3-type cytochrome oxidase subunit 1